MSKNDDTPQLLTSNTLVFQQTSSMLSNDFRIEDAAGNLVGQVLTTGGVGARLFRGSRTFDLLDERGNLLLHIKDPFDMGFDRYELITPDGSLLANVRKQFSMMRKRLSIEMPGLTLELAGSILEYDFSIRTGERVAAQVSRQWGGVVAGLRGRSRYSASFDPDAPEPVRLAIVGALIALDLMRAKDARN